MTRNTMITPGRAVALALMLVISIIGATVAFGGGVVAAVSSAERTINNTSPAPGDTVQVTVDVQLDSEADLEVSDTISPEPDNIEVTNDDGATLATSSSDEAVASWGSVTSVSLVYEVTIPDDASDGDTFTISGTANDTSTGNEMTIGGDSEITVDTTDLSATREIAATTVPAGESTNVTVTIQAGTTIDDLGFADGFNSSLSASVLDDDGATISAVSSDEVVASWGGVSGATITYEVTVPENASTGTTYDFAGTVEDRDAGTQTTIDGDSTIDVGQPDPIDQYRNDQGVVDSQGLLDAAADFRAGDIGSGTLLDVAAAFRSGEPVT